MLIIGEREGRWFIEDLALAGETRLFKVAHTRNGQHGVLRLFTGDEAGQAAAERAASALQGMDHASIPSLLDRGETRDGEPWIVTEAFEGRSVGDLIAFDPMEPTRAARIFEHLGEAIAHLHERGWIHRDVNPETIIVTDEDEVWLIGFEHALTSRSLEKVDDPTFGPLGYVAPEVLRLYTDHGHRADLYSTGVVLYEAITGRSAFPAAMMDTSANQKARSLAWKTRDRVLDPGPDQPQWLRGLVKKATQPDPTKRLKDHYALLGWLDAAREEWDEPEEEAPSALASLPPFQMGAPSIKPSILPSIGPSIGPPAYTSAPQGDQRPPAQVIYKQEAPPPALHGVVAGLLGAVSGGVLSALWILVDLGKL
ncbi:MAG: protein kinase [Proteobacteria bacterium]|nr:protein kinase [Pseudomonadota bacterium]